MAEVKSTACVSGGEYSMLEKPSIPHVTSKDAGRSAELRMTKWEKDWYVAGPKAKVSEMVAGGQKWRIW